MQLARNFIEVILYAALLLVMALFFTYAVPEKEYGFSAWIQAVGSIAAIFVAIGVMKTQHDQAKLFAYRSMSLEASNSLQVMLAEIRIHLEVISELGNYGVKDIAPNKVWSFPVYLAHVGHLGKMDDSAVMSNIVRLYGAMDSAYQYCNLRTDAQERHRLDQDNELLQKEFAGKNRAFKAQCEWANENGPEIAKQISVVAARMRPKS